MEKTTYKTNSRFTLAVKVLMLAVVMSGLTACSGATFVKSGMDPLKGNERVGIVVPEYKLYRRAMIGAPIHLSDKVDVLAAARMGDSLKGHLLKKGFTSVIIPASDKVAAMVKRFNDAPRDGKNLSDPSVANLGDLRELFKENDINYIMLLDGEAVVPNSGAHKLTQAAIETAAALALRSIVYSGNFKGAVTTRTTVVEPDGKVSFYKELKFAKDFTEDRDEIATETIKRWTNSRK